MENDAGRKLVRDTESPREAVLSALQTGAAKVLLPHAVADQSHMYHYERQRLPKPYTCICWNITNVKHSFLLPDTSNVTLKIKSMCV